MLSPELQTLSDLNDHIGSLTKIVDYSKECSTMEMVSLAVEMCKVTANNRYAFALEKWLSDMESLKAK